MSTVRPPCHRPIRHAAARRARGFTLLELMIITVVIGILGAIAFPAYQQHVAASRRADAKGALLDLAQRMERIYAEQGTYANATLGSTGIYPTTSPQGHYTMSIVTKTSTSFLLRATRAGKQVGDACGNFGYDHAGSKTVSSATLTAAKCW